MFLLLACTPPPDTDRPWDAIDEAAAAQDEARANDTGELDDDTAGTDGPTDSALVLDTPVRVGHGDLLRFTPSEELGHGALALQFTEVEGGSVWYSVYVGGQELFLETSDLEGANVEGWFTVSPGVEYMVMVEGIGGQQFSAELLATFTSVPDRFEPNDSAQNPAPMGNTSLEAYFHSAVEAAYVSGDSANDCYSFSTTASRFSVELTDVSAEISTTVDLYAAIDTGDPWSWENGDEGEDVVVSATGAGDWVVCVRNYGGTDAAAGLGSLPDHLTSPYTLTVTR